jgi:hypothetical protein
MFVEIPNPDTCARAWTDKSATVVQDVVPYEDVTNDNNLVDGTDHGKHWALGVFLGFMTTGSNGLGGTTILGHDSHDFLLRREWMYYNDVWR